VRFIGSVVGIDIIYIFLYHSHLWAKGMHGDVSSRDKRCTEYCILINTVKNRQCNLEDLLYKENLPPGSSYINYVNLNCINKLNVSLSVIQIKIIILF
jgi:hypothetical protein